MLAALREWGTDRESWYLQSTPQGSLIIVSLEADDPADTFARFAAGQSLFDQWFKEQTLEICGIDFNQPGPPLPVQIFSTDK